MTTHDQAVPAADPPAWRVLLAYARPYRLHLLAGGLLSLATGAVGLALPLGAKRLVDGLAQDRPVGGALLLLAVLAPANAGIGAARSTTVLVVAHRLSTVTMADRIVVLDAGRVRAIGTHAELLGADPLYAELAATQFLVAAD